MPGRAPALFLVLLYAACDGPIRLDVVTAIPSERPGGDGGTGNTNTGNTGNRGEGSDGGGGVGGSPDDGGAAGSEVELAGAGGQPELPEPWDAPTLYQCSFASYSLPGQYIRYRDALAWVTTVDPVTEDAFDATFEVIVGMLGDDEQCFSIRRLGGDYSFMRHSSSRIRFTLAHDEPLFLGDATFCFEPGLAEPTWVSFRSYNYPNQFIRMVHNEADDTNELFIDADDGSPEFAADATFRIENPFEQP